MKFPVAMAVSTMSFEDVGFEPASAVVPPLGCAALESSDELHAVAVRPRETTARRRDGTLKILFMGTSAKWVEVLFKLCPIIVNPSGLGGWCDLAENRHHRHKLTNFCPRL